MVEPQSDDPALVDDTADTAGTVEGAHSAEALISKFSLTSFVQAASMFNTVG
jgi:hypothetical protein